MKMIWILLIFIVKINFTFGQANIILQGQIIDRSTNDPISFATIFYQYGGAIADEYGLFRISEARPTDTLRISCIGYLNKHVLVSDLETNNVNEILLDKHIYKLAEVKVKAKKKRIGSIQIIRNALSRIEHNYPTDPILYHGYYREYLMQNDQYYNLLESIIDLEDQGFGTADKFDARILYKKQNQNFEIKEGALIPYDNSLLKIVPDVTMPKICNELLLLRIHDPIRRSNYFSLSYIDTLQMNFIRNHHFKKPELVYFNNKTLYLIQFKNANLVNNTEPMASTIGEIYIDPENWGIHKMIYKAYLNHGKLKNKLYELNLSYQRIRDQYYLNYLSFNNYFQLEYPDKMFRIKYVKLNKKEKKVVIEMSNAVDSTRNNPKKTNKYKLNFNNKRYRIDKVQLIDSVINIYSESFARAMDTITKKNVNNVSVRIDKVYDINGFEINVRHIETFYQYREFFVRNSLQEYEALDKTKLYDPSLPMLKNPVYIKQYNDTIWINTPLIK